MKKDTKGFMPTAYLVLQVCWFFLSNLKTINNFAVPVEALQEKGIV